jgi:hypothetical protein
MQSQVGVVVVIFGIMMYSRESYNDKKMSQKEADAKAGRAASLTLPIAMGPLGVAEKGADL